MSSALQHEAEELSLFRDMVIRALESEVLPNYEQWEKEGITPRHIWNQLGDAGMLCVDVPEAYGGYGAPYHFSMMIVYEIARMGFGALATNVIVHSDIVSPYINNIGNEEQKSLWLPKLVSGDAVGAIAMTEPGAGSDLQGIRTTARKDGDQYIISGSKTFITNGQHADLVIVAAKTDPSAGSKGISLFLIDTQLSGFSNGHKLEKIGMHCADTSEIFFDDVRVSEDSLLGELGHGFSYLMKELARERLSIAMAAAGATRGTIDITAQYADERKMFGQKLKQFQNTRFKIAEMETDYQVNKAYVDQCVVQYTRGELDAAAASIAKYSSTEMQFRVADSCLQLFGGYGYMTEYPISRAFVDARVQRIYGGTSEIMKEVIARSVLGKA